MNLILKYPFVYKSRIRWGEMDALAHLNNTVYFRYSEEARIQMFMAMAINVRPEDSSGPILAYIDCQFLMPVVYPDTLLFGSWIQKIGSTSLHVYHDVYSQEYDRVVAQMKSVVVMVAYKTGKKVPITRELRDAFTANQHDFDLEAINR